MRGEFSKKEIFENKMFGGSIFKVELVESFREAPE